MYRFRAKLRIQRRRRFLKPLRLPTFPAPRFPKPPPEMKGAPRAARLSCLRSRKRNFHISLFHYFHFFTFHQFHCSSSPFSHMTTLLHVSRNFHGGFLPVEDSRSSSSRKVRHDSLPRPPRRIVRSLEKIERGRPPFSKIPPPKSHVSNLGFRGRQEILSRP